jgi:RNA polymerase-binding transcription factor DksA
METETKKTRYSDSELQEFKDIILKKLEKAKHDLKMLTEAYINNNEHGTNDTSPTFKVLEEGNAVLTKEENSKLAARQEKFIRNLEMALIRIENKTYGVCRETGRLISKERLRSVPHATLSIDAKLNRPRV